MVISNATRVCVALYEPVLAGAESIALRIAQGLDSDHEVGIATLRAPEKIQGGLGWEGATGDLRDILFGDWDLLHTHLFLPGLAARVRRLWDPKVRWVHTVHYSGYAGVRWGRLRRWLDHRFIFPEADGLVAVSPKVAEGLSRFPRLRVIPNTLSTVPPLRQADPPLDPGQPPTLLVVAMLRPEKGLDDLLDAVGILRDRNQPVRVRIAGEGPMRGHLETRVEELDLSAAVRLEGYLDNLSEAYDEAHLYVQPSREESFGLATLEAMARGVPLCVADAGFLPELVGWGEYGVVASPGPKETRAEALARGIAAAISDLQGGAASARRGWERWGSDLSPEGMTARHREAVRVALFPRVAMIQPIVTHSRGGLQRQLHLQTRELARRGYRITLVQRRDPVRRRRAGEDESDPNPWSHLELREVPDLSWLPTRLRGALFSLGAFLRLMVVRPRPDVLHAHQLYSPTLVGAAVKALRGGRLVSKVTAAGVLGEAAQLRGLPFPRVRGWALRRVDRVLALHEAMADELRTLRLRPGMRPIFGTRLEGVPDPVTIVPNSVELPPSPISETAWTSRPFPPGTPEAPLPLLWVGRISEEKGLDVLLRALAILAARGTHTRLDLVGGPDPERNAEPALRAQAASLPKEAQVRFLGPQNDVPVHFQGGPVFILPSRSEGMSNALLEAMAWGLPCVVSDIAANRALVHDGKSGLLFRDGDPEELARVLGRFVGEPGVWSALGAGARARVESGFSVLAVVEQLEGVYRNDLTD